MTRPSIASLFEPLTRDRAVVFRLHRFRDPELDNRGHDPAGVRRVLEFLRGEGYELVSLPELFRRLSGDGPPLRRSVAFTIDDGYVDQASVGLPLFLEFDCPVTIFVTTGFLDGRIWFWWDKIKFTFAHASRSDVRVRLGGEDLRYSWSDTRERDRACADFVLRCKSVPEAQKCEAIERLAMATDVRLPQRAPARYAPMSWAQLRDFEKLGVTVGPHTVTHPVLARTTAERSRREIVDSWTRVKQELAEPIPVFAYPNGRWQDFGQREIDTLRGLGFTGALAAVPGYNSVPQAATQPGTRYSIRRFGNPDSLTHVIQYVSGLERLKQIFRGEAV